MQKDSSLLRRRRDLEASLWQCSIIVREEQANIMKEESSIRKTHLLTSLRFIDLSRNISRLHLSIQIESK